MVELIATIILVCSLGGIGLILAKKIPILIQLSKISEGVKKDNIVAILEKRIKNTSFDKIIFLKTLSKVRVYILKIEKYVDNRLQGMRKKIVTKQEEAKVEEKKKESNLTTPPTSPM